ncbi:Fructose-1,6-bisphosphatase, type I [hydrothermal vent metagenome]|uniref:fructose-bisphosphatase n=1 Tax=hydrothermal vent metagenome TaxID=652676 RepID=A0A1W1C187_9ZZZZ
MQNGLSLKQHLKNNKVNPTLSDLIIEVALTTKEIAHKIDRASLEGALGLAGSENIQGEDQKKLDIITNDVMFDHLKTTGLLAGMGSEEMDDPMKIPNEFDKGDYLIFFDPLDGSSNIDVNISVGTIFSIIKNPKGNNEPDLEDYLSQKGTEQVASGFVVYGPSTTLVLTTGNGVSMFTLDKSVGEYTLVRDNVIIPNETQEFAINMSNQRFWEEPVQNYIADCLAGETGVLGKRYNMRWVASMVAEIFRILTRGGIFLYPVDERNKEIGGKLRLMYEANPISMIIEQAGGMASTGRERIMDIQPNGLHQRVPVIMGSKLEVEKVIEYHQK